MDKFQFRLNDLLADTFHSILKYEESSLRRSIGVTVGEAHLIEAVGDSDECATVSEIADTLGVAVPTATVAIQKLVKKGFATKTPSGEDGRRYRIGLTEEGRRAYRTHRLFHKNMMTAVSGVFSESEKTLLLTAIEKLNGYFKGKLPAAEGKAV